MKKRSSAKQNLLNKSINFVLLINSKLFRLILNLICCFPLSKLILNFFAVIMLHFLGKNLKRTKKNEIFLRFYL